MHQFPGWPGPAFYNGRPLIANVMPPTMPMVPMTPGYPGGAPGGMPGGMPWGAPGGPGGPGPGPQAPGPGASPIAGLAAYGVPISQTPNGSPVLRAGGGAGSMLPPQIPGMPNMPGPPDFFMTGGPPGGPPGSGLFQPAAPVAPFNQANQVGQYQAGQL